jgi:hypothetical protein
MSSGDSASRSASASVKLTSTQAELLTLLNKLVCLIASDAMTNMQDLPEVCKRPFSQSPWGNLTMSRPKAETPHKKPDGWKWYWGYVNAVVISH